jgi:hypothetical protein
MYSNITSYLTALILNLTALGNSWCFQRKLQHLESEAPQNRISFELVAFKILNVFPPGVIQAPFKQNLIFHQLGKQIF